MQASNASTSRPVNPLNISAAFAQFAHLPSVTDGRSLHRIPFDSGIIEITGNERPAVAANKLLEMLKGVTYSLNAALTQPILDQRVITLYKENSEHEHAIQKAALTAQLTHQALSAAHQPAGLSNHFQPSMFGLELPLIRSRVSSFILTSLEKWAGDAGLEFFLDDQHAATESVIPFPPTAGDNSMLVKKKKILASITKEQLLVDMEFECHPLAEDKRIDLVQNDLLVPISLQEIRVHNGQKDDAMVPLGGSRGGTLQALLEETVREFLTELGCDSGLAWRDLDVRRAERAAARLKAILGELNWIADTVKQETEKSVEGGLEWSDCITTMGDKAMLILRGESEALRAQDHANPVIPADILALRASGIPIPYLLSFCLGFLLHLPPLAYLTALRHFNPSGTHHEQEITDIPLESIRQLLSSHETRERLEVLVASISYEPNLQVREEDSSGIKETTSLSEYATEAVMSYSFLKRVGSEANTGGWVLSFSLGGTGLPVIISQSRMKRVANAIGLPMSSKGEHNFDLITLTGNLDVPGPSWLDLVMDPQCTQPSRVYTSRYQPKSSASSEDPDLVNTLVALTEPGFALGKIPVRALKDAYSVMAVVKEQIWLHSLLHGVGFRPGYGATDVSVGDARDAAQMRNDLNLGGGSQSVDVDEAKALYDALMNGTYVAKRLRVTYEVLGGDQTGVRMTFPLGDSVVLTEVTLDITLPRGVKVVVDGDRVEVLEEVVRRGGLLGLVISVRRFILDRA